MNLPPRALQALIDLKQELLSKSDTPESYTLRSDIVNSDDPAPLREEPERRTPERRMRHARRRSVKFQRMCQSRHRF